MNDLVRWDARLIGACKVLPRRHGMLLQRSRSDLRSVVLPACICIDSTKLIIGTYFHILLLIERRARKILLRVLGLVLPNTSSNLLLTVVLVQSNLLA